MKKRLSWGITGAALLCALVFAACQQEIPTEYTVQTNASIPSLPGPGNIQAANVTGGVLLTWEPVYDAKGYEVWRRKNAEGTISKLAGKVDDAYGWKYADIISDENKLEPSTEYHYTILAVSGNSTGRSGVEVVQNGRSERYWTTGGTDLFPAKGTAVTVAGLTLKVESGVFNLSWTKNTNSAVVYDVGFTGISNFSTEEAAHALALVPTDQSSRVYTATVQAKLGDGLYYPAVEQNASVLVPAAVNGAASFSNFTATRDAEERIKITFDNIPGAEYTLYKTELTGSSAALAWAELPTTNKVLNSSGNWEVIDTADIGKTWYYQIKAAANGNIIVSQLSTITKANEPQVKALDASFVPYTVVPTPSSAMVNDTAYYIAFKFAVETGADYKVYRQKVGNEDGYVETVYGTPVILGDWTEITGGTAANGASGDRTITYLVPEARQKYNYKVVGTRTGFRSVEWTNSSSYAPLEPISTNSGSYSTTSPSVSYAGTVYNSSGTAIRTVYSVSIYNIENSGYTGGRLRAGESITFKIRKGDTNGVYTALPWTLTAPTSTLTVGPSGFTSTLTGDYYVQIPIPGTGSPASPYDYEWIIEAVSK